MRLDRQPLAVVALLVAISTPLAAQQVCARGLVEKAPPFSICVTAATHVFRCPNLRLQSSTVDLNQYLGQIVEVCGTVRQVGACLDMTVTSVRAGVDGLAIAGLTNGQVRLGQPISFDIGLTPGTAWVLLYGAGRGWTSLGPIGMLQIASPFTLITNGVLGASGRTSIPFTIPNDPSLVNANVHFQNGFVDLRNGIAMGNSDCFVIQR